MTHPIPKTFNPNDHVMQLKSKQGSQDYLPVQWRLVWFRQACPEGTIETEIVQLDLDKETEEETYVWSNEKRRSEKVIKTAKGMAIFRATVRDGKGGLATGTKMEKAASFPDWLEKAETGAIGRALAALGYGTQFAGEELSESHRIVDSPVDRTDAHSNTSKERPAPSEPSPTKNVSDAPSTSAQKPALLNMIDGAKKRVQALDMEWADVVRDTFEGLTIEDGALTVQQVARINGTVTTYEKKRNAA